MSTQFFSFSDDTPFSTEAVLVNASSSHYEEDWPSIPHTHAFTELFYVSEGSGEFLIENQHFSIKKDDLIIVNPHIQHTEISLSASPLSYYTVGVDGISFSFHDQKEFQIFHCHQKHADLLFYFHSLFQELCHIGFTASGLSYDCDEYGFHLKFSCSKHVLCLYGS